MEKSEWIKSKIFSKENLLQKCNIWRTTGKRIVFTNGCFDILHYGHLHLIANASNEGDALIVAINTDYSVKKLKGEERPINSEQDRAFQLASLLCVDAVVLFNEDTPEELIKVVRPDVLLKGGDYDIDNVIGADFAKKVIITPFVDGYSTTGIIKRIRNL